MTQASTGRRGDTRDRTDRIQVIASALVGLVATVALAALPYVQDVAGVDWYNTVVGAIASACFLACIPLAARKPLPRVAIRWTMATMLAVTLAATGFLVLAYPSSDYGTSILLAFATVFAGIVFAMTFADGRHRRPAQR